MWLLDFLGLNQDPDRLFSYNTRQQVNILDRYLGLTQLAITWLVVAYIVGFDLWYCEGYFQYETAKGIVATHSSGDAYVVSSGKVGTRYFSSEEISYPGLENGNIFVATRVEVHSQKRAMCDDHLMPCTSDDDCSANVDGECSDRGFCFEPSWCEDDQAQKELYEIPTADYLIWVKSAIQYIQLKPNKIFMSDMSQPRKYPGTGPAEGYNTFSVRDLLNLCSPTPVRYEEISELGAAIEVQFVYDCNVNWETCHPTVQARRLDTIFDEENIGFGFSHAEYTADGNERELVKTRGVRIWMRTTGRGRKISPIHIIMKCSTGLALLSIGPILVDWLMINVFFLKDKYYARKYAESEDFSDFLNEIQADKAAGDSIKFGDDDEEADLEKS